MPENLGNRCTWCSPVTSINEKSGRTPRFQEIEKQLQAADNKGYKRFGGEGLCPRDGLI